MGATRLGRLGTRRVSGQGWDELVPGLGRGDLRTWDWPQLGEHLGAAIYRLQRGLQSSIVDRR